MQKTACVEVWCKAVCFNQRQLSGLLFTTCLSRFVSVRMNRIICVVSDCGPRSRFWQRRTFSPSFVFQRGTFFKRAAVLASCVLGPWCLTADVPLVRPFVFVHSYVAPSPPRSTVFVLLQPPCLCGAISVVDTMKT